MRRWLRGTRARLTITYAVIFALVAGLAAVAFSIYLTRLEAGAIDDSLTAQTQAVVSGIDSSNGRLSFQGGDVLPGQTAEGIAVDAILIDDRGHALDQSGQALPPAAVAPFAHDALAGSQPVFGTISIGNVQHRVRAQRVGTGGASGQNVALVVTRSTAEEQSSVRRTELLLIAVVVALTTVASILGYVVAGRALRPVRVIAATARDISERDLHRRIDLALPPDELGELAATFNEMLGRLEAAFASLQRFTADAAHELRAPLSVMLAEVQVSLRQERSAEDHRRSLRQVGEELERLSRLADHLLVLARADAGALRPRLEALDLADFLEERVDQWRPLISQHGLTVATELPDVGRLAADPELLRRLVDNLLSNAVAHTPSGGTISVSAAREGDWWGIEIADTGPGIPPPLRVDLFERFTRGDPARGRESGGAGLGMAICAAVAHAHGGSIALGPGPGARFIVRVPADGRARIEP
ncbi:MAG: heavy metal sensor histidine kinase [Candidatus Dormibacteraeota bacterium]|uniref:histidine kinase n=1 Tax=Candidatus Amunia macphersoniae TaxID=3127014 RepID=A0A934KLL9_9BACT|nr:heavy metal sensor histidine kinase [Candidatus Dormibacteraeota bacterium]